MKITHKLLITASVAAMLALPAVAAAQCNPNALGVQFMDLKLPFSINTTGFGSPSQNATSLVVPLTPSANPSCAGWFEAVIKVKMPVGCSQANIWVEYEGTPIGWTLDVGDSPGNDGFGGDSGEPDSEAELQVLEETLSVYSMALGPGIVDLLAQEHLGLSDGALEIVVGNQYLSWGQPFTVLETPASELLLKLPDAAAGEPDVFFIGINRVISNGQSRTGCGARRVMVSFR